MEVPAIKRGLKPENACTEVWQIFASKVFRVIMDSSMKDY